MADITTRQAKAEDKKNIYDVLVKNYYTDMPLFSACNLSEPPTIDEWPALQELHNGLTVVAESKEGSIVGVAVNVVPKANGDAVGIPGSLEKFIKVVNENAKGLVVELEKTTMELSIMTVSKECRGKGIAKKLIDETEKVAKSIGRNSLFAIATNAFMEAAFCRMNWEPVYVYLYENYRKLDPDFKVPPAPHSSVTIFLKKNLNGVLQY